MTRHILRQFVPAAAVTVFALACRGGGDTAGAPMDGALTDSARRVAAAHALLAPGAQAALDSGNVLFRKKQYQQALTQYRAASALSPQHAAPYFGVYLVARATGDSAMANTALAEIKKRNGPAPASSHQIAVPDMKGVPKG